jgi:hypothetical protein
MNSSYHSQAISFNSHAVTLLQKGDFVNAIAGLSAAFISAKEALQEQEIGGIMNSHQCSLDDCLLQGPSHRDSCDGVTTAKTMISSSDKPLPFRMVA